jgi:hypothetical protein
MVFIYSFNIRVVRIICLIGLGHTIFKHRTLTKYGFTIRPSQNNVFNQTLAEYGFEYRIISGFRRLDY